MARLRSPFAVVAALLLPWCALRVARLACGGELGSATTLSVGGARVTATLFGEASASSKRPLVIAGHGGLASKVAAAVGEGLAIALADVYPHRDLAGLLRLPIGLTVLLAFVVASWERASRAKQSATAVESGVFTASLLGAFLALLIPSW